MGKTRPSAVKGNRKAKKKHMLLEKSQQTTDAPTLLAQSAALLQSGEPDAALSLANRALSLLPPSNISALPVLSLLGEIYIELGEPELARDMFAKAAELDPEGLVSDAEGGGAEKFLWLAQLSEDGGMESIAWYEKGIKALERSIEQVSGQRGHAEELEDKRRKVEAALCSMVEVWMTDLSLEVDAEANCESLIARALLVSPTPSAPSLQTLASVRLSQTRLEDARSALNRSMEQWKDLPPGHSGVPDFPTRISLARLLMEAEMEDVALEVVERLVGEDDESVEAWYLGGWCLWLMANKQDGKDEEEEEEEEEEGEGEDQEGERRVLKMSSREWLRNCLKLYSLLEYEDERLKEHAQELVDGLDKELGEAEIEDDDEEGWEDGEDEDEDEENEDEDDDEDHQMEGA